MMNSAEKKRSRETLYIHIVYYCFGRQEHEQVQNCKQLFTLILNIFALTLQSLLHSQLKKIVL